MHGAERRGEQKSAYKALQEEKIPLELFGPNLGRGGALQPSAVENSARTGASHIRALDGLRGLAVLTVIYGHASSALKCLDGDPWPISGVLNLGAHFGSVGLDLFYVLSGFLITRILFATSANPNCLRNFYTRRVLRIFPVYYTFLIFCLVILPPFLSQQQNFYLFGDPKYHIWLWFYGTNIIKSIVPYDIFHCLEHFWSLAVEEHYYGVWPSVVLKLSRTMLARLCVFLPIFSLLMRFCFAYAGNSVGAYVFTLCRLDGFAAGALMALLESKSKNDPAQMPLPRGIIITTLVLVILVGLCGGNGILLPSASSFVYALLLFCALKYPLIKRPFEAGLMRAFGRYSYGAYVWHLPVLFVLGQYFPQTLVFTHNRTVDVLLFYALSMGIPIGLGFLSYHLFERHFLALKDVLASR